MTVSQGFSCQVDEIEQFGNLVPQTDFSNSTSASANCVRVFYELMNDIYVNNSSSTSSPIFLDGENLTGNNLTTSYFKASNNTGAITVSFTSNFAKTINSGWEILVSCETLSTLEFSEDDITIYPNAFNDKLFITSNVDPDKVMIYDMNGKQVYKKNIKSLTGNYLNLNQLNTPIYFLKLINKDSSYIKRIVFIN